jgi:MFS family permease
MGLDNLSSLFMLPLFGKISDNCNSKRGKRTPFIYVGTVISVFLMIFVPITANAQLEEANTLRSEIMGQDITPELLGSWWDSTSQDTQKYIEKDYIIKSGLDRADYIELATISKVEDSNGTKYYKGTAEINEEEYTKLSKNYDKFVKAGVNTYIGDQIHKNITVKHWSRLLIYMIILLFVLLAMATFRSPAVALMPDVTPKPLRSQANAIINLAGGVGGAIALIIYTVWLAINKYSYVQIYITSGAAMLVLLYFFMKLVDEPKLVKECHNISEQYGLLDEDEKDETVVSDTEEPVGIVTMVGEEKAKAENKDPDKEKKMEKAKKRSFFLILASIFMWFMGYNAVTSNLSVYTTRNLLFEPSVASLINAISMAFSAIAFIPVGFMAVKFGRRKSIIFGFILATVSFFLIYFITQETRWWFTAFYLISGFGLIIANVNTFPMVVELSKESNVGKYTGYYYTATMSAQAITPFIGGLFMQISAKYLFIYSAVCVIVAIVLMFFVKHGDSKAIPPQSKLEMIGAGDD